MFNAKITAVAHHVPEKVVTNLDLEKALDTSDEWIRTRTGISERRVAARGEATSDLAVAAALKVLHQRGVSAPEIDCIIVATVTPDMFFPSTACIVQDKIGASRAWGFDLSGACAGFLFAVSTAAQFIHSGAHKKVLVVGADVMTSILDPFDRDTFVLFGDGAGAVLMEPTGSDEEGVIDFILQCDGSGGKFLCMPGGGSLHPATHKTVDRRMHFVHQNGRAVFKTAVQRMADVSAEILARNHLTAADISLYVPHQANLRIIDAVVERLGISDDRVVRNIDLYANTTAATIPIGISESYQQGKIAPGELLLMASFGAGFTWGSVLMRWSI